MVPVYRWSPLVPVPPGPRAAGPRTAGPRAAGPRAAGQAPHADILAVLTVVDPDTGVRTHEQARLTATALDVVQMDRPRAFARRTPSGTGRNRPPIPGSRVACMPGPHRCRPSCRRRSFPTHRSRRSRRDPRAALARSPDAMFPPGFLRRPTDRNQHRGGFGVTLVLRGYPPLPGGVHVVHIANAPSRSRAAVLRSTGCVQAQEPIMTVGSLPNHGVGGVGREFGVGGRAEVDDAWHEGTRRIEHRTAAVARNAVGCRRRETLRVGLTQCSRERSVRLVIAAVVNETDAAQYISQRMGARGETHRKRLAEHLVPLVLRLLEVAHQGGLNRRLSQANAHYPRRHHRPIQIGAPTVNPVVWSLRAVPRVVSDHRKRHIANVKLETQEVEGPRRRLD